MVLAADIVERRRVRWRADAESIARKLDVAYLLEGSVQRSGNIIRVAPT